MICSGIYLITFIGSNKSYIGSSYHLCKRGNEHLCALKGNYHCNKKLQNAFNKYGEYNFIFEYLEVLNLDINLSTEERDLQIRKVEQKYLDTLLCANTDDKYFRNNSYNLSKKAMGGNGISSPIGENHPNHRKISVFDLNMKFIEEIGGVRATERKYKVCRIDNCCKGLVSKCGNYIFRYSDSLNITYTPKINHGLISVFNDKNEFLKDYSNYNQIAKEYNIHKATVRLKCLDGKLYKSMYFKYKTQLV